jgi:hypothetical protein
MLGESNMDRDLNPSTVLPTENAKSILESTLLAPDVTVGKERRGGTLI